MDRHTLIATSDVSKKDTVCAAPETQSRKNSVRFRLLTGYRWNKDSGESVVLRFRSMCATMLTQFFPELFAKFIRRSGSREGKTTAALPSERSTVTQALISAVPSNFARAVPATARGSHRNHQEGTLFAALSLLTNEGVRSCRRQQPVGSSWAQRVRSR